MVRDKMCTHLCVVGSRRLTVRERMHPLNTIVGATLLVVSAVCEEYGLERTKYMFPSVFKNTSTTSLNVYYQRLVPGCMEYH